MMKLNTGREIYWDTDKDRKRDTQRKIKRRREEQGGAGEKVEEGVGRRKEKEGRINIYSVRVSAAFQIDTLPADIDYMFKYIYPNDYCFFQY